MRILAALALLCALTGCAGEDDSPASLPGAAPTATSPPTALTVKTASVAYLAAVKGPNAAQDKFTTALQAEPPKLTTIQSTGIAFAARIRTFSLFLGTTRWPVDVQASAADARAAVTAEGSAVRLLAGCDTLACVESGVDDWIEAAKVAGGKIDLLRQDLGLPAAS